jgi:hypothetical protein
MTGGKPTVESLGIDVTAAHWQRSGSGDGAIEVALVGPSGTSGAPGQEDAGQEDAGRGVAWVLMRVAGDSDGRVLVYDRFEWECFLDGVRAGEFDPAGR